LRHAVYAPVADESVFSQVRLEGGAPTWLGGRVDFAPETLIARSVPMR
jgi:hypothetical protein